MATPILDITELSAAQVDQYLTANEAIRDLESATNDFLSVDLSSGNVELTAAQYRASVLFRASGNTVARDLTLQAIKRLVIIDNSDGTATLSIILGATTLTLSAGEKALYYTDGTANGLVAVGGIDINSYDTDASPDAATDFLLTYDASEAKHKKVLIENLPFSGGGGSTSAAGEDKNPVAILTDRKAAGTGGGTATSGTDITRDINTVNYDPDSIVSLASNQFTLQAGTYKIEASVPGYNVGDHSAWLYNVTDAAIPSGGEGSVAQTRNGQFSLSRSWISCVVTIASAKAFEIRHRVAITSAGGLGPASATWQDSVYTMVKIVKLTPYEQRYTIGRRTIDFASDANYTLSTTAGAEEWKDKFLRFTDTGPVLTAGRDIIFPDENGPEYIFTNDTAQTLTCKRSGQTGVAVAAGNTVRIYHDGTDMVTI